MAPIVAWKWSFDGRWCGGEWRVVCRAVEKLASARVFVGVKGAYVPIQREMKVGHASRQLSVGGAVVLFHLHRCGAHTTTVSCCLDAGDTIYLRYCDTFL